MANPITWQNIDAPLGAAVATPILRDANASVLGGIDKFSQMYEQYQKDRSAENTAAYEAELAKYTTPEALKAARDGGVLASLGQKFGIQMDQNVLKNGVADAMTRNINTVTADNNYTDMLGIRKIEDPVAKFARERTDAIANQSLKLRTGEESLRGARQTNDQNAIVNAEYNSNPAKQLRDLIIESSTGAQQGLLATQKQTNNYNVTSQAIVPGIREINYRKALPDNDPNKLTEESANQVLTAVIENAAKVNGLTTNQLATLLKETKPTQDGVPNSDARVVEIAQANDKKLAIFKAAEDNSSYYRESLKSEPEQTRELNEYITKTFNKEGWFNANPTNVLNTLSSYIGKSVEVDGKKQVITPSVIIAALDSGLAKERWFSSTKTVDPSEVKDKITEVMNRSGFKQNFAIAEALKARNYGNLKKALNIPD